MSTELRRQPVRPALRTRPPQRRRRTHRRRHRLILVAVVSFAVAVVVWVVAFSPVLGANQVTVRGNHTVSAAQIRDAARVPHGRPLIRLDTGVIRAQVAALPEIATAHVAVSYPSTVTISVTERVAVGYVTRGAGVVLVDKTGKQFRTVPTTPAGLPRFDVPPGEAGEATGEAVATVAGVLPAAVLSKLAAIQASDPGSITLQLRDQRTVRWGNTDRSADKARILPTLLGQPGSVFDVSNPEEVFAR